MSDFGAGACDFHSDFASDFRTEGNDYASDFRDFPGNYDSDFGREARHHQKPRPAWRGQPHRQGHRAAHDGGKLAAHRKAEMRGGGCNATPQGHKQGVQRTQSDGNVGTVARVKAPYRGVKMANKAYNKKSPEYTGSKGKPRTACAMRGGGHFWSLARSKSKRIGCNRIYNRIKGGTSLQLRDKDTHILVPDKLA